MPGDRTRFVVLLPRGPYWPCVARLSHPFPSDSGEGCAPGPVTVGIDIGTTSVKALAVDENGRPLLRARIPHQVLVPAPDRLEHDPVAAWVDGPRAALAAVGAAAPVAVAVSAMTPSMTPVDAGGSPIGPGVLYDDVRGRPPTARPDPISSGETAALLAWAAQVAPEAAGYWPAQAVANRALGGGGVIDYASACSTGTLFDGSTWDPAVAGRAGAGVERLPGVALFGQPIGTVDPALVTGPVPVLGAGGGDAFCEQLVAGADQVGDVLIVCGSTLVVWVSVQAWPEVPGLWTLPHLKGGMAMVGGASNAGGLFLDWVDRMVAAGREVANPAAVPVWWPYVRGERVPLHEPLRRAALGRLDLTAGPAEVRRAAREASAFVARHIIDTAGVTPGRVVVSGGGTRDQAWMQALADGLGRPVEPVAVPEGAALGAAWLARMAAGLETSIDDATRWACSGQAVEPDPVWVASTADRYQRYRAGIAEGGELRVR